MIKKLRSKIFTLMMLSLSIIVIGIIILFAVLNCNNAIHLSRENIARMTRMRDRPNFQQSMLNPEIQEYQKVNTHIQDVVIFSCAASGLALIIIYVVSKKVSEIIVKPVEDTLEKQKQFISDASHELKTPLTSMKVLSDSLLTQEDVPVELYKEFMGDLSEEIERENKIINDLLSLVKMDKTADKKL